MMHSSTKGAASRRAIPAAPALSALLALCATALPTTAQALPSWNDGPSRQAILAFVQRVTTAGTADFVPPEQRIAVFDNDGTLWAEQPMYFQLAFMLDRVNALAPQHPEWQQSEPFRAVLAGD